MMATYLALPHFHEPRAIFDQYGIYAFVGYYIEHLSYYRNLDNSTNRSMQTQVDWSKYRAWLGDAQDLLPIWALRIVGTLE